ncbi:LOW QUALITY PROTEIN: NLR family CARD domain-containing protein 3-like [Neosynchiropus ocellatus]
MDQRLKRGGLLTGEDSAETRDREEGDPPSKQSWCGDHDDQTRPWRPKLQPEPPGPGQRSGPGQSCVSLQSDRSMSNPPDFSGLRADHHITEHFSRQHLESTRTRLGEKFLGYVDRVWRILSPGDTEPPRAEEEGTGSSIMEEILRITVHLLRDMEEEDLADYLWSRSSATECGRQLKKRLKQKFQNVSEGVAKTGNSVPLNQIYTELYITKGGTDQINQEHEVRQIEVAARNQTRPETIISQKDFFRCADETGQSIRCIVTKGVAGSGMTLLTRKLTLDWAEDKAHQNFKLVFPFTFRELNLQKEKKLSLVELVQIFFPETKGLGFSSLDGAQVLFILDGLDECRLPLDFNSRVLTESTESTSVDILLTNLIKGNLLASARLWITSRPAAAKQIPPECVGMVTEVRGFTELQKEEYFRKRFRDDEQTTIISHIRSSQSLYIMCHIPMFCWITATVLEDMLKSRETGELPKTLTEMYIHFLVVQAKVKKLKYHDGAGTDEVWTPESRKMIESLGKLAFVQLQRGNFIFYESDLRECGIDITAAAVYSGVFTLIFREERGLYQDKVFCFAHISLQEFLAALHVHLTFTNSGINLLDLQNPPETEVKPGLEQFYQTAVVQTLESPKGHLDLFLRFLLGLSLKSNQNLLRNLVTQTGSSSWTNKNISEIIKKKISEDISPERTINLFHCLNELNDTSLVKKIQQQLKSRRLSRRLSPAQWSALAFILLSSEEQMDVFDLSKYSASEDVFLRLMPVVRASSKVLMIRCGLSERSCPPLSSVLSSPSSSLTQLDLSNNQLGDSGVELLCAGLESPHCHLQTLRLRLCGLSDRSCPPLSSALRSPHSSLTQLDLSDNELLDLGVKLLCIGLESPDCHLETLSLSGCLISEEGCASLASALRSNPTHLRELDLNYNHPGGPGLEQLTAGLESPDWRLDTLRVDHGGEARLRPGLLKYVSPILDPDTAHRRLLLSDNKKTVRHIREDQLHPAHPDTFYECEQLMCREVLTGRCYWGVKWTGRVRISVTYRRNNGEAECLIGDSDQSWSLDCSHGGYFVSHIGRTLLESCSVSEPVGVFLDCPAGSVSFYRVSPDARIHLHTIFTSFTQPLYPGFSQSTDSSVSLCDLTWSAAV